MNERRSSSPRLAWRACRAGLVAAAALVLGILLSLSGCGGLLAEEVTPELRALEVNVSGGAGDEVGCELNYDWVGAGRHPVAVIAESGPATVRIVTRAGTVVFESQPTSPAEQSVPAGSEDELSTRPESASEEVRLVAGDYRVECESGGSVSTERLRVEPVPRADQQ